MVGLQPDSADPDERPKPMKHLGSFRADDENVHPGNFATEPAPARTPFVVSIYPET